jgi:hypothetical protein
MKLLIEEYRYRAEQVRDVLHGIDALENVDGYVSVGYVGYFYNTDARVHDCVFILPKVLLESVGGVDLVFGKYRPEDIIDVNSERENPLTTEERKFIYEFAVWIYRTIVVYHNDKQSDTSIVYHKQIAEVGHGRKHLSTTYLDVLLSLVAFHRENRQFFFYVLRNLHSGLNKINWTRTIATTQPIIQQGTPVYLDPVNKRRQVNFDEELIIIFYSILDYISKEYGFPVEIDCHFELIRGARFRSYLQGLGLVRLRRIKYKYFSDKALELWGLCYAFFDAARQVPINSTRQEYLLVKNFNIVFEAIIDELVGDPRSQIPTDLMDQPDGKRVDHMYSYQGLTTHEEGKPVYYIGDSKYYKRGNEVGRESVYKQFTYARNVIQWNLDLFMSDRPKDRDLQRRTQRLRDDVTEGYNIVPNFFISARLNDRLSYEEMLEPTERDRDRFCNLHFKNRLFDRDTLLVCHYDVNFLYVVSLYARNNASQKAQWKSRVRSEFRRQIQKMLSEQYDFYAMEARPGVDAREYIQTHFQQTLGKIYKPFDNERYLSLALDRADGEENEALLRELKQWFLVEPCSIGSDPEPILRTAEQQVVGAPVVADDGVLLVMMEKMDEKLEALATAGGRLAVGVKYTEPGMNVLSHVARIGYVLFHVWRTEGQRLYRVTGLCRLVPQSMVPSDYYMTPKDPAPNGEIPTYLYVLLELDMSAQLPAAPLDCTRLSSTKKDRYDCRFATVAELAGVK